MIDRKDEYKLQRRVAGYHDVRLDGLTDIVLRARGHKILDLGCNRGLISFEMANNGAALVHGCDIFEEGIRTARELFIDLRNVESRFEVIDLTIERPFPEMHYDIILMIATLHKLKRMMTPAELQKLISDLSERTIRWFVWRGNGDDGESSEEMAMLDRWLGLKRVHTSSLSRTLGLAAIWERQ